MPLDADFIASLERLLVSGRIGDGIALLTQSASELAELHPGFPQCGRILLLYAQWIDAGFGDYRLLLPLLERFGPESRSKLLFHEYVRVRMAAAFVDLSRGEPESAIEGLGSILRVCADLRDPGLEALAHFWIGRAQRKSGAYEASLEHMKRAYELAQDPEGLLAGIIEIQQSWLQFQKGQSREAERLLNHAESILKCTDHYIARGNIESARGRIVRRAGQYGEAIRHFDQAKDLYSRRDPNHVNVARTLVNAAYVYRLMALQVRKEVDAGARAGRTGARSPAGSAATQKSRTRHQEICREAMQSLKRASEIYALHGNPDGMGKVSLNLGFLHLDRGDLESATSQAIEAYALGAAQRDRILMARARMLGSAIENAHVEEQTGDATENAMHANRARQYSDEAIELANGTQNQRLKAGACIARAMTAANEFFLDWEAARAFAAEATSLIGPGEHDHLVEDLALLKAKIARSSGIEDELRNWSEGSLGGKTYQQVVEEFAELVIPKVWIRQHRKISRVAETLSISPKKVRRILRSTGHIDRQGNPVSRS